MNELDTFYKNALIGSLCEPLCDEYKSKWRAVGADKIKQLTLAMNQQAIPYVVTYCNKGKGVSKDYILREYGQYINGFTLRDADGVEGYTYGLYVDYDYYEDLVIDKNVSSIMWTVGATIVVPTALCPIIYISNHSKVHLVCEGYNTVRVYLFDDSELTIESTDETCDVVVLKYSGMCKVVEGKECLNGVKQFTKQLRL